MAATYNLIASQVLGSNTSSVTFSSIPQTYSDLIIKQSGRSDYASVLDNPTLQYNSDTTSTSSYIQIRGANSTVQSYKTQNNTYPNTDIGLLDAANNTASTFSSTEIYIPNYTLGSNTQSSVFSVSENNATTGYYISLQSALWRGTSAITTITFRTQYGTNFVTNSSFYLYGLKSS